MKEQPEIPAVAAQVMTGDEFARSALGRALAEMAARVSRLEPPKATKQEKQR